MFTPAELARLELQGYVVPKRGHDTGARLLKAQPCHACRKRTDAEEDAAERQLGGGRRDR